MNNAAGQLVTVFGGSGFVGRHVVRALARRGYRIRVAVRRPDLAHFLQPLGAAGQIHAVQANLRFPDSVAHAVAGADAVVNLVGLLAEGGKQRFATVQAKGAKVIAEAAKAAGVARIVHLSAIGADAESPSAYARSKAEGETMMRAVRKDVIVLRPSIVFGPEDQFFNRFADLATMLPFLPLIGGDKTLFQPVFVGDVAEVVARAVDGALKAGATYELGGREVRSFEELLRFILKTIDRDPALVPLPFKLARMQAGLLEFAKYATFGMLPEEFLITRDQVALLEHDNVVSAKAVKDGRTLEGLGIVPETIEAVVPNYLWRFRKGGQFASGRYA
jgi:NADH dehydrogenase